MTEPSCVSVGLLFGNLAVFYNNHQPLELEVKFLGNKTIVIYFSINVKRSDVMESSDGDEREVCTTGRQSMRAKYGPGGG